MNSAKYWLLWAVLAVLAGGWLLSCATPRPSEQAPPRARRYYQHRQRLHQRQRAHFKPALPWN